MRPPLLLAALSQCKPSCLRHLSQQKMLVYTAVVQISSPEGRRKALSTDRLISSGKWTKRKRIQLACPKCGESTVFSEGEQAHPGRDRASAPTPNLKADRLLLLETCARESERRWSVTYRCYPLWRNLLRCFGFFLLATTL